MRCVFIALVLAASPASAVTFQYVGAVPRFNTTGIPINTGTLTIDPAKIEGGTLANARLTYTAWSADFEVIPEKPAAVTDLTFAAFELLRTDPEHDLIAFDLQFDEHENLASWNFLSFHNGTILHSGTTFRISSEPIVDWETSETFYEDYVSWSHLHWSQLLIAGQGQWFKDDPAGFERALAHNVAQATPVPLPAGLPLILGGVALMALLRRRG